MSAIDKSLLVYALSFTLPWFFLFGYWIKNRKEYTFNIPGFDSIDGKKGGERIKAIDDLYRDTKEVERLILNSSLFYRKAYLMWYTDENKSIREILTLVFSAFLSCFATSFCTLEFLGKGLVSNSSSDAIVWPMSLFLLGLSVILCILLKTFLGKPGNMENLIYVYELSFLENALDKHMGKCCNKIPPATKEIRVKTDGEIRVLAQKDC